jgi:hypothetical protein
MENLIEFCALFQDGERFGFHWNVDDAFFIWFAEGRQQYTY